MVQEIIKGDDTNWNDQQTFVINIITELDLSQGFSAEFYLGDRIIVKEFDEIIDNKVYPILSHEETILLPTGYIDGTLKIFDSEKRIRTIKSNIPFFVRGGVYSSNKNINAGVEGLPVAEINVTVSGTDIVDYNSVTNKPKLNGFELKGEVTLADIGLGNIDNTSDLNKPISNAVQTALDLKADKTQLSETETKIKANSNDITEIKGDIVDLNASIEGLNTEIGLKANTADVYNKTDINLKLDEKQNVGDYALKSEIPNISGLVTQEELTNDLSLKANEADVQTALNLKADKTQIPTKTSQLTNDSNFLTSIPEEYVTESELTAKNYATKTDADNIADDLATVTQTVSQQGESLNDLTTSVTSLSSSKQDKLTAGNNITIIDNVISSTGGSSGTSDYTDLTNKPSINSVELSGNKSLADLGIQAAGNYALKSELPTKVSQLQNDSNFLTSIPAEYITETELSTKNYATTENLTSGLATKANTNDLAVVATTGSYNDLTNKPVIPEAYTLPVASTTTLGGVKVDGTTITASAEGIITAVAGGTSDYTELTNKPQINSIELSGNKTLAELGIQASGNYLTTETASTTYATKTALSDGLATKQDAGDYATKTDVSNVSDDLATITNQVGAQGTSLNELTTSVTSLSTEVGNKANTSDVVALAGDQTITGKKHFNGGIDLPINKEFTVANGTTVFKYNGSKLLVGATSDPLTIQSFDNPKIYRDSNTYENIDSGNISTYVTEPSIATTSSVGTVKPDGTTITITADGTISSVGGSGGTTPANMVTTDTVQTITANKTFEQSINIGDTTAAYVNLDVYGLSFLTSKGTNQSVLQYHQNELLIGSENDPHYSISVNTGASPIIVNRSGTKTKVVESQEITKIKKLTQAEYDALTPKDENTFYAIVG